MTSGIPPRTFFDTFVREVTEMYAKAARCEQAEEEARAWEEEAEKWKTLATKLGSKVDVWRSLSDRTIRMQTMMVEEMVRFHRDPSIIAEQFAKQVYNEHMRFFQANGYTK